MYPNAIGATSASSTSSLGGIGQSPNPASYQAIFDEFEAYPFTEDPNFNAGLPTVLQAIRGTKRTAAQIDEMIGQAQWFFFNRMKGMSIPWEAYASYANAPRQDHPSATPSASPPTLAPSDPLSRGSTPQGVGAAATGAGAVDGLAEARRMMASDSVPTTPGREGEAGLSFATLCDLISEGRAADVPGVQKIPDQLNELPPSQSVLSARPKPWEQQRTSPHGASAMFHNPSLAPTPPASDMAIFGAGFTPATAPSPLNPDPVANPSYLYPNMQYPLSPLMGVPAPQHSPAPGPFDHAPTADGVDWNQSHTSRQASPLQSFANLSFAPAPGTNPDLYGFPEQQGQYDPSAGSGTASGAGGNGQPGPSSGYYSF